MTDKVVVVTGASSGLGAEAARHLAKAGAKLALGARRTDRLQALAEELGLGRNAVVRIDVTDRAQVKALVDHAVKTHGRIDAIINNAGLMPLAPLELLQVDEWDRMIDVNIKGVLYGIAAARLFGRRTQDRSRRRQARRARDFGGPAAGGEAVQHPHDNHLAGGGRDRAARQHHGAGRLASDP